MKKFKKKKNHHILFVSFIYIVVNTILLIILISSKITKPLTTIAEQKLNKITNAILNENINYEDFDNSLIEIIKNKDDEIVKIDFNVNKSYHLLNDITKKIRLNLLNMEYGNNSEVEYFDKEFINYSDGIILRYPIGVLSNKTFFTNFGPRIPVKIKFIGNIISNLKTNLKSYGINNVLVELYIEINLSEMITTPVTYKNVDTNYKFLIASSVISGKVPSYYNKAIESNSSSLNIPF